MFSLRNCAQQQFVFSKMVCKRALSSEVKERISSLIPTFCEILGGEERVKTSQAVLEQHGRDESHHGCKPPSVVLFPQNTKEVSELSKTCYHNNIPMVPFGAGTGLEGGTTNPHEGTCFDLSLMNAIVDLNPEDFDVKVQAGVTRKTLNQYLHDTGLWFPVDPGADASLCGMAATSASGTNAVRYRTMRENVMNLEVVLGDGTIIDTAGKNRRTKKTSAGYNMTNLFVGSEGTLGTITHTTLRLYGIPEAMVSAVCEFPTVKAAVDTSVQILQCGIPIARIAGSEFVLFDVTRGTVVVEFLDDAMIDIANKYSGLDYKVCPTLFLEFHGSPASVEEQAAVASELATDNEGSGFQWATKTEDRNRLWKARHELFWACRALRPGCKGVFTDACVPISRLTDMIVETKADIDESGVPGPIVGHVGDGNFHVAFLPVSDDEMKRVRVVSEKMTERALAFNGTCTGEHGIGLGKRHWLVHEVGESGIEAMQRIKSALDPKNLMNPGKVFL